ncbi:MAG: putative porin [Novosphingobium sp.]
MQSDRIQQLERKLELLVGTLGAPDTPVAASSPLAATVPQGIAMSGAQPPSVPALADSRSARPSGALAVLGKLDIAGDLRLRQEFNTSQRDAADRSRSVIRLRLGARYALDSHIVLGARLVTGDQNDPNTADVTLSNFADDIPVNLDQVYAAARFGRLTMTAGKFPQVFDTNELLWDGDVNAQGFAASFASRAGGTIETRLSGMYFIIEENVAGKGSALRAVQAGLTVRPTRDWTMRLAGSYYDYTLGSVATADTGDFRGNRIGTDGRYLSDYRIVDAIGSVRYTGLGAKLPIELSADLARNFGAPDGQDTALSAGIAAGRAIATGDWRASYVYSQAETDAVFAAFSHDNIAFSTNYSLHSLSLDHVLSPGTTLNATWYHYRLLHTGGLPHDWLDRIRLNLVFQL